MQKELISICILIMIISCKVTNNQNNHNNHIIKYGRSNSCRMYTNEKSRINDSVTVQEIISKIGNDQNISKEEIEKSIFSKSTVELLRVKEDHLDFQISKYLSCEAKMLDSVIYINFRFNSKYVKEQNNWGWLKLQLVIFQDGFETKILSFSDTNTRPKEIRKGTFYDKLELNNRIYAIGDTICGKLELRNELDSGEIYVGKGSFKAIIIGETEREKQHRMQYKKWKEKKKNKRNNKK